MNLERENLGHAGDVPGNRQREAPLVFSDTTEVPEHFLDDWPENGAFYQATRDTMPGFTLGYLVAHRAGARVAVVPYFVTDFKFNTMLDFSWLKPLLGTAGVRIACVGHPTTAFGRIEGEVDSELLDSVFSALSAKAPIVAFKGFGHDLPAAGFVRVAGLPVAMLHLEADFWNTLHNHKQRNDFTRKLKASAALRFEEHEGMPEIYLEQVHRLYLNTREHAAIQFECLSRAYFSATSGMSTYLLAFLGDRLVGFAQMLVKGERMVGKYMGMDYAVNREHDLYFALYFHALDICRERGFREIEFGETGYRFKQAIGCELVDTWLYYRHRNPFVHILLARLAFLLEPSDIERL